MYFGFVDGTARPVCRHAKHQRVVYIDYKRIHSVQFQSVTLRNGIIANIFGPVDMFCIITFVFY